MDDLWLLYNSTFDTTLENPAHRMLNEALKHNIKAKLLFYPFFKIENDTLYYLDKLVDILPKIVFIRGHEVDLVAYFEKHNVKTINSAYTIKYCRDKLLTHTIVGNLNIPQIKTDILGDYKYLDIINKMGSPFVLKYRSGCQGKNIYLINNEEEFKEILPNINKDDYLIQEYIDTSYGKDLRVYIVGDNCVGAVIRENTESFTSNLAMGGLSYNYELTEELIKNSLEIKKALNGDIISVDYVFGKNGLLFCEANTNAGFASFNYLGYPMREIFMRYIKELLKL